MEKKMKKRKSAWIRRAAASIAAIAAAVCLGGCGAVETLYSGKGEKEYGKAETMVILTTERLRYENVYSEEIWTAEVDGGGTAFETVLTGQIHDFLKELKVMSLMAREKEITLSSREKELAKTAAGQYMDALGSVQAEEFGLTEEKAEVLYTDYWTAEKLVETITGDMNLEVSDSEAKVISVAQIQVSDRTRAEEVRSKIQEEGMDFFAAAKEYSEDPEIKKQLWYGLMGEEYEKTAFSMASGEVSPVVEDGGKYYILRCENDYDEAATRVRKEQMMREKRSAAFYSSYQAFQEEHPLTGDEELWQGLTVTGSPAVTADFFEIFETVCAGEEQV